MAHDNKTFGNFQLTGIPTAPRGVVSTAKDPIGRKTVVSLIETDQRIYPIGRLDYDTTGVIILTNDGELTNILLHH